VLDRSQHVLSANLPPRVRRVNALRENNDARKLQALNDDRDSPALDAGAIPAQDHPRMTVEQKVAAPESSGTREHTLPSATQLVKRHKSEKSLARRIRRSSNIYQAAATAQRTATDPTDVAPANNDNNHDDANVLGEKRKSGAMDARASRKTYGAEAARVCEQCGRRFTRLCDRLRHVSTVHGTVAFVCQAPSCPRPKRAYSRLDAARRHQAASRCCQGAEIKRVFGEPDSSSTIVTPGGDGADKGVLGGVDGGSSE
jgi:hypothetical protein